MVAAEILAPVGGSLAETTVVENVVAGWDDASAHSFRLGEGEMGSSEKEIGGETKVTGFSRNGNWAVAGG